MYTQKTKQERFQLLRDLPIGALCLLLPITMCGLFGHLFMPHDPTMMNPTMALKPPSWLSGEGWTYLFGTDYLGRDVFSRVIVGARASLIVSFIGVGIAGTIGVLAGISAGWFGKKWDAFVVMVVDIQRSIPGILMALLLCAVLGAGLWSVIIVIAIRYWTHYARIIRGETMSVKQREYVTMATSLGGSPFQLLLKHVLPNVIDSAMIVATMELGNAVMLEATLSFLGLGVQPPAVAWGKMIAESRMYIATAWWLPTFPGLALFITVLGANLLGDWLRDKLDPKLRQV